MKITSPLIADDQAVIIGFSARLPACETLSDFWQCLVDQRAVFGPTPARRLSFMRSHWAAFIETVDEFDAAFFKISPLEASLMDPQQGLLLQEVWRALHVAALDLQSLKGSATGVYVGVSGFDYTNLLARHIVDNPYLAFASSHAVLANRISHCFDLWGPSEAIDTACSSGLSALDRAVTALKRSEIDQAIVCGVNLLLDDGFFKALDQLGLLSRTKSCKPFGAGADGYLRGEGIIVVILQRKSLAHLQNKTVYAEILASGVSHCGHSMNLGAPKLEAQCALYERLYKDIDISRLSYIEANATGLGMADAIELAAWKAFIAGSSCKMYIGSLKANIGHLEAASGLASLIKILFMFHHKIIPGQVQLSQLTPYVDLAHTGIMLARETQAWSTDSEPFLAGLSAFGRSGVLAHLVLTAGSLSSIPVVDDPFLRQKFWFEMPPADYIYIEQARFINEQMVPQGFSNERILLLYSSKLKGLEDLACDNTLVSLPIDDQLAKELPNCLQHTDFDRLIISLEIPDFDWSKAVSQQSFSGARRLYEVLKIFASQTDKLLFVDVYTSGQPNHPERSLIRTLLKIFYKIMPHWQIKHLDSDEILGLKLFETKFIGIRQSILYHQQQFQVKVLTKVLCTMDASFLPKAGTYLIIAQAEIDSSFIYSLLEGEGSRLIWVSSYSLKEAIQMGDALEWLQTDIADAQQVNLLIKYLGLKYASLDSVFVFGRNLEQESPNTHDLQKLAKDLLAPLYFIRQLQDNLSLSSAVICSFSEDLDVYAKALAGLKLKLIHLGLGETLSSCEVWETIRKGLNSPHPQFAVVKPSQSESIIDRKRMEDFFEVVTL